MVVSDHKKIKSFLGNRRYFRDSQDYMELRHHGAYHSLKTHGYWDSKKLCQIFAFESMDKMFEIPEDLDLPIIMRQISKPDEFVEVSFDDVLDIFELSGLLRWDRDYIIERLNLFESELI